MSTKVVGSIVVANGLVQSGTSISSTADGQHLVRDAGALNFRALTPTDVPGTLTQTSGDARYEQLSHKGAANGYCGLDAASLIPSANLPPLAITDTFVVASQAAMLALTAQVGDVAVRTDTGQTFILSAAPPATLGNWVELKAVGQVVSVNGQTGTVNLTAANVGAQPLDGDLTSLAAATGTSTIYYRSAADTWSAVTVGSGLSFSAGTLSASGAAFTVTDTASIDMTLAGSVLSAVTIGLSGTIGD